MPLSHEVARAAAMLPLPDAVRELDDEAQQWHLARAVYGTHASEIHRHVARQALHGARTCRLSPTLAAVIRDTALDEFPGRCPAYLYQPRVFDVPRGHQLFDKVTSVSVYLAGQRLWWLIAGPEYADSFFIDFKGHPLPGLPPLSPDQPISVRSFHFLVVLALLHEATNGRVITGPPDMPTPTHPIAGLEPWLAQRGALRRQPDGTWSYATDGVTPRHAAAPYTTPHA